MNCRLITADPPEANVNANSFNPGYEPYCRVYTTNGGTLHNQPAQDFLENASAGMMRYTANVISNHTQNIIFLLPCNLNRKYAQPSLLVNQNNLNSSFDVSPCNTDYLENFINETCCQTTNDIAQVEHI